MIRIIVIDTETTGLDPKIDELLQVSIIDNEGTILYDSYIKPTHTENWDEAMAVNHITPEMVADFPTIDEAAVEINRILTNASEIIGYNTGFDLDFLSQSGIEPSPDAKIIDVMQIFSERYGEWSEKHGSYKWISLVNAAAHYDYDWSSAPAAAHNSVADCYATLYVYDKLTEEDRKKRLLSLTICGESRYYQIGLKTDAYSCLVNCLGDNDFSFPERIMPCVTRLSEIEYAELEQSEDMEYSISLNLDDLIVQLYQNKSGFPDDQRNEENSNYLVLTFKDRTEIKEFQDRLYKALYIAKVTEHTIEELISEEMSQYCNDIFDIYGPDDGRK